MSHSPAQRRTRTIFHYKVDERLRPEDRDVYLALIRAPQMRNEDAHAWLAGRGISCPSPPSRVTAVGQSRETRSEATAFAPAEMFANSFGRPGAADFAAGAEAQFQYLVLQHIYKRYRAMHEEDQPGNEASRPAPMNATELLNLSKLVSTCIDLSTARIRRHAEEKKAEPKDDEALRQEIWDILEGRK